MPKPSNLALTFILATVGLDAIGIGLMFPVMPDLMMEVTGWDARWIGISLAVFGIGMVLAQALLIGLLVRRYGERQTALLGMGLEVATYGFYGFVTSGFWALVFTPVSALGGVTGPALQGMMSRQTPETQQGELAGINASLNALAMIVTPLVMTTIFAIFTAATAPIYLPGAPFLLSAVLMVGAVLVFVAGTRARAPG